MTTVRLLINPPPIENREEEEIKLKNVKIKEKESRVNLTPFDQLNDPKDKNIYFGGYKNILERLFEQNRKYFTPEYGRNESDLHKYLQKATSRYDDSVYFKAELEPKFDLKNEVALYNRIQKINLKYFKMSKKRRTRLQIKSKTSLIGSHGSFISTPKKTATIIPVVPFEYRLSDPTMMEKGISLDTQAFATPLKLFIFKVELTNPHISSLLLERPDLLCYNTGELLASNEHDDRCIIYNKCGSKAVEYMNTIIGPIIVLYSATKRFPMSICDPAPLAIFDLNGNGVIYDEDGKKRLLYDQAQGILFDTPSKLPIKWRWKGTEKILARREELKYIKPDDLDDITLTTKLKYKAKKDISMKTKPKKKPPKKVIQRPEYPIMSYSKKSDAKAETPYRPSYSERSYHGVYYTPKVDQDVFTKIMGDRMEDMKKTKIPVVLKFSRTGCAIEPLQKPCEEFLYTNQGIIKHETRRFSAASASAKSWRSKSRITRLEKMRDILGKCFPETSPSSTEVYAKLTDLKPFILKVTDTVSVTVASQDHIHIDFISQPHHFIFEIGVTIDVSKLNKLYSIKNSDEAKEQFPCYFEILKDKCYELSVICNRLKQMRYEARQKAEKASLKYLKTWGYDFFMK